MNISPKMRSHLYLMYIPYIKQFNFFSVNKINAQYSWILHKENTSQNGLNNPPVSQSDQMCHVVKAKPPNCDEVP